jgi:hypothetical protein
MRRIVLAITAAAAVSAAPAEAAVTTTFYGVNGPSASGTFSVDFDSVASTYTLTGLNILVGAQFGPSDVVLRTQGTNEAIDGSLGGIIVPGFDEIFFSFNPAAASQTTMSAFTLQDMSSVGNPLATILQTGGSGSTTNYSVGGLDLAGTFSLDFNAITTSYSLSGLDILVGNLFDASDVTLHPSGSNLAIDGSLGGIIVPGFDELFFTFNPNAASQTSPYNFTLAGSASGIGSGQLTITRLAAPPGVPEPSTWAMALVGFGALGLAIRRRRGRAPAFVQE